jgi:hypothetical protein
MGKRNGSPPFEHVELLLSETQRRFLLLIAEANECSLAEALRMVIDEAIDTTHIEHRDAPSLRWLLEHADRFDPEPWWLERFGRR